LLNYLHMTIRLFLTGGTFDKEYDELTGELGFDKSHIEEMLKVSRYHGDIKVSQLLLKDSLDMNPRDRDFITQACRAADENLILITHGTDTMAETARVIQKARLKEKTIVLTGAMVPYSFGIKSDTMFNLGNALAFVQVLPAGVYIAMNGHYFKADNVYKDKDLGVFKEK
jgi:L-asparaginase